MLGGIDTRGAGFTDLKKQAIAEQGRGRNGKLQLQFIERLFGNGNSYADTGYQASWEATRAQAGSRRILVFYSGGNVTDGMSTRSPYATITQPGVASMSTAPCSRSRRSTLVCQASGRGAPVSRSPTRAP